MTVYLRILSKAMLFTLAGLAVVGCQNELDATQYLNIKMFGILTSPEGATGSTDPISQQYTVEGIYLTPDPITGESISLYTDEPQPFTIIQRPQIIYKREIAAEWVGLSFDSLVVRLSSDVTGVTKYSTADSFTIGSGTTTDIGYVASFDVEKGQGIDMLIQVQWKNTVTVVGESADETSIIEAPSFDVSVSLN